MRSLVFLTVANVRSFVRDRAALFWTILFPVIFIVLFGVIFSGGGSGYNLGIADQDNTATSQALLKYIQTVPFLTPAAASATASPTASAPPAAPQDTGTQEDLLASMKQGKFDAVLVIPKGFGAAFATSSTIQLPLYVDPSNATTAATITQAVTQVEAGFEQRLSKVQPVASIQTDGCAGRPAVRLGLLRAQHPGHGPHAAGHLQRHPAGRAAREEDPQAPAARPRCRAGRWSAATSSCGSSSPPPRRSSSWPSGRSSSRSR